VEDTVKRLGGIPVVTPVGTANLKKGMLGERAIFGGESSNHMYFSETFNFDDAVFASLKMAEIISEIGSLSEKLDSLPNYPYLSEWDFECPDEKKFGVVGSLKEKFKNSGVRFSELDGVKLMWDDGWVLWRASNTRPQVKVYLEAKSDERFEELKNFAKAELLEAMGG
jgi:phosphomannomutase